LGPAEAAAGMTFRFLLHPERAARLVNHHALNAQMPALEEVVDKVVNATWKNGNRAGYPGEIARLVDRLALQQLAALAAGKENAGQVRAVATAKIGELKGWLTDQAKKESDAAQRAHFAFALSQIKEFETNPAGLDVTAPLPVPAGAPIGSADYDWLDCQFRKE
jgi:hypothetical protein